MNDASETVGQRIRRLRQERGLSLRDLATPGVSYTYLSRVESGLRTPSVRAIRKLAQGLGVSAEYLESGVELNSREELELALADLELGVRLEPEADADVEQRFRDLIARAGREGQDDLAIRAQAALGVRLSGLGRLMEAIELIEAVVAHPLASPVVFTEAYLALASSYIRAGREREAAAFCERALEQTPADDGAVRLMLATHLSSALADIGDLGRAQQVLDDMTTAARRADPYTRVRVLWSQARLATARNQRQLALRHMQRAITILEGTEDTIRLARAHLVCAQILLWGDRASGKDGAEQHLRAARGLLPAHSGREDSGALLALEALLAARCGDAVVAEERSNRALEELGENGWGRAAALYARGLACRRDDDLRKALSLLENADLWREAAMVARDRAKALVAAGDLAGAELCLLDVSAYELKATQQPAEVAT